MNADIEKLLTYEDGMSRCDFIGDSKTLNI